MEETLKEPNEIFAMPPDPRIHMFDRRSAEIARTGQKNALQDRRPTQIAQSSQQILQQGLTFQKKMRGVYNLRLIQASKIDNLTLCRKIEEQAATKVKLP